MRDILKFIEPYWNTLIALAMTLLAVVIPLHLVEPYASLRFIVVPALLLYGVDLLYTFLLEREKSDIFSSLNKQDRPFLSGSILLDMVALAPLLMLVIPSACTPVCYLFMFVKMPKLFAFFNEMFIRTVRHTGTLKLFSFLYVFGLLLHWISCGWLGLSGGVAAARTTAYVDALYWTVTTLTSVGYGDITPETSAQKLYAAAVMILGVGLLGFLIGDIVTILSKRDPAKAKYRENMGKLATLLNYCHLPGELQGKIHQYYRYLYYKRSGYDEATLLAGLPKEIKREVSTHLRRDLLDKVPLFQDAPPAFLREIAFKMKHLFSTPDSYVLRAGETGSEIYFVVQGELDVILPDEKRTVATLYGGDFFGEIALFEHIPRTASVKSRSFCDLYTLSKQDFELIIRRFPNILDEMRDKAYKRHAEISEEG